MPDPVRKPVPVSENNAPETPAREERNGRTQSAPVFGFSGEQSERPTGTLQHTLSFSAGKYEAAANAMEEGGPAARGFGQVAKGVSAVNEYLSRTDAGESRVQAGIGAGARLAIETVTDNDEVFGGTSRASSVAGLAATGLKMMGGAVDQDPSQFGVGDAGELVDLGAKAASPNQLAQEGVKEGLMNVVDMGFATASGDWEGLAEKQLSGRSGSITQGYAMMGEALSSVISGDDSNLSEIGSRADRGELGTLPKIGGNLGNWIYHALHDEE